MIITMIAVLEDGCSVIGTFSTSLSIERLFLTIHLFSDSFKGSTSYYLQTTLMGWLFGIFYNKILINLELSVEFYLK